jgi:hypothetical protein
VNGVLSTVAGAGSVMRVEGANATGTGALTVLNGFTNNAAIELSNANLNQAAQLTVSNGTLTNALGGTISALAGATGGGRTLTAELDNQGTVTVNQPLTINRTTALHKNSGTFTIPGGDVTINLAVGGPSFTNSGLLDVSSGHVFKMSGGNFSNAATGAIQGSGTLDVSAAAVVSNAGSVSPGGTSPGILTWTGGLTMVGTGVLNIQLDGQILGTQYDQLAMSGLLSAASGGTLNVTKNAAFDPKGLTFTVVTFSQFTPTFQTVNLPIGGNGQCTLQTQATQLVVVCP